MWFTRVPKKKFNLYTSNPENATEHYILVVIGIDGIHLTEWKVKLVPH